MMAFQKGMQAGGVGLIQRKPKDDGAACALRARAERFAGVSLSEDALDIPRPYPATDDDSGAVLHRRLQRFVCRLGARR